MIVFCEDCGQKNTLPMIQPDDAKVVFTCASCRYPNDCTVSLNHPHRINRIKAVLNKTLAKDPSIIGYFVFHPQKRILLKQMPDKLKPEDLQVLAQLILKRCHLGHSRIPDIEHIHLRIGDKRLTVFMNKLWLVLVIITTETGLSKNLSSKILRFFCKKPVNKDRING